MYVVVLCTKLSTVCINSYYSYLEYSSLDTKSSLSERLSAHLRCVLHISQVHPVPLARVCLAPNKKVVVCNFEL
jgi:hypothetical protein